MMRRKLPILISVFFFTCSVSLAQSETPALSDLIKEIGVDIPVSLLPLTRVQADLAISPRQKEAFQRIDHEQAAEFRKLPRVFDLKELSEEARKQHGKDLRKLQEQKWESSFAVLDDAQRTRLAQIVLQQLNERAIDIPAVMDALKLTVEQKGKIEAVKAAFAPPSTKSESSPVPSREEMARIFDEARRRFDQRNAAYLAVLTEEQSAAFVAMKGKPCALYGNSAPKSGESIPIRPLRLELTLITQDEVQKELNFTAEQTQRVAALLHENREAMRAIPPNPGAPQALQPDGGIPSRTTQYMDGLLKVLNEKQVQRLTELTIQKRGVIALREPQIAEKLKLTAEQQTQLRRIDFDFNVPERIEERRQAIMNGNRAKNNKLTAEDRQRDADYLKVLTEEQKAAFEAMQGKKFTFPDPLDRLRKALGREEKPEST